MELLGKGDQLKDWAADGFLIDMVYHFRCSRDSPFFEYTGAIHRGPHDISSAPFWGDSTPYRMAAGIASQNLYDYQNINNLLPWSHIGAIRNGSTVGLCGE